MILASSRTLAQFFLITPKDSKIQYFEFSFTIDLEEFSKTESRNCKILINGSILQTRCI